jgi:excisionase family DNA binding protein
MTVDAHYTTADLKRLLKCSDDAIYNAVHTGELKAVRVGKQLRFAADDVNAYLNRDQRRDRAASNLIPFVKPQRRRPA